MKTNWRCLLALHNWKYYQDGTERHCLNCNKEEIFIDNHEFSGFQTPIKWQIKDASKRRSQKSLLLQILAVFALLIIAVIIKSIV